MGDRQRDPDTAEPSGAAARVARARSIRDANEAVAVYRDWAAEYDDDVISALGFIGSDRIADLLAEHATDRTAPVIDLGCGTGAAGARLQTRGFELLDGLDISPEMLAVARGKQIYRQLFVVDLLATIPIADGTYAASVSAGTFTSGHVGPAAIPEILRILRPAAVVAWVVARPLWPRFEPAVVAAGIEILHCAEEPIRRSGEPEATMLVGRLSR